MKLFDMVIIGGGSAGMSAALSAYKQGIRDILIIERGDELGGILQQCIHNGFGLQIFHEELSGPMYAERYSAQIQEKKIAYCLNTTVMQVTKDCRLQYMNAEEGCVWIRAKTIIFASGCYERNRGAISIPGKRLPGVYTAGSAQKYLNLENIRVGKKVFILGSGDIGLIMARRMTLEGARVEGVAEIMPYSNGLTRNIVQCLEDYQIPLYLSHTVTDIKGTHHVEAVTIAQVDENRQIIAGSEKTIAVDTLLLSIGLLPEMSLVETLEMELDKKTKGAIVNECFETSIPHIYACGNALHVHDIVDNVSKEAADAATCAALDILQDQRGKRAISCIAGSHVSYVLPQCISKTPQKDVCFSFRVSEPCSQAEVIVRDGERILYRVKKARLLPAEMERVVIKKEALKSISSCEIEVRTI